MQLFDHALGLVGLLDALVNAHVLALDLRLEDRFDLPLGLEDMGRALLDGMRGLLDGLVRDDPFPAEALCDVLLEDGCVVALQEQHCGVDSSSVA